MGVFPKKPSRSRLSTRLPVYEKLNGVGKERDSNDSYDDDSDYEDYSEPSSPSPGNSRNVSSASPMMPKRAFAIPPRPVFYRLPNKIVRYLCLGLISFILLLIFGLVRASQHENWKISAGKITKGPGAPPPWESFEFLTRYYGGVRNLVPLSQNTPEYPRPEDELPLNKLDFVNNTSTEPVFDTRSLPASKEFADHPKSIFKTAPEEIRECFIDKDNKVRVPAVRYFDGRPNGFPEHVLGSYGLFDLPEDICFERYGRYAPYGFGYSVTTGGLGIGEHGEQEGLELTWDKVPRVEWKKADWADIQRRCYQANIDRYKPVPPRQPAPQGFYIDEGLNATLQARDTTIFDQFETSSNVTARDENNVEGTNEKKSLGKQLPRTAVVIRCWDEFMWREEDVMNLRSLISELSLASGGRYDVHLLVQVKNDAMHPIWADAETYQRRIIESVPVEFHGLVTLWTETQMLSLYQGIFDLYARGPDLPVHGVYRGLQMAMQYFAYQHPEYDYFWQWEMDIRYTGHYYDFFTKTENWAKAQPRKGLWERNARFYVPSVHGTWEDFKQMARVQSEMGAKGADNVWNGVPGAGDKKPQPKGGEKPVWGPERPVDPDDWFEPDADPVPETSYEKDKYVWGVGEEAEYIAFNPLYDPEGTTWGLADDITGYNTTVAKPPRRAQIITASRMSRRMLLTMHRETAFKKHHAFPEMWPATVALQHGYKAAFAPHPLYVDREWPTALFAQTLNNGRNGAAGGSRTSVFGDREHNLRGLTWFYNSGFAPNLYRRWLGLKVNNDGGEEFERAEDVSRDGSSVSEMRGGEGRMCLPPMLLHPVKDVELPVEHLNPEGEVEIPESDPGA